MRAAVTGAVDFSGCTTDRDACLGEPGDYLREPDFSAGAWRGSAVAAGGLRSLIDMAIAQLRTAGRLDNQHQLQRLGNAMIAWETSRLWVRQVAQIAEDRNADPARTVAYARARAHRVEAACLDAMRLVQRSLGLSAFRRGNPVERVCRDLATYLRQPAPDEVLTEAAAHFADRANAGLRMITAGELHERWRALPIGSLNDVIGAGACLVLAPHPDDESLGCGGLIAACCAAARPPLVVILTDGSQSHPESELYPPPRLAALREAEATKAVRILGLPAERLIFMREPDARAPHAGPAFDAIVRRLVICLRTFGCSAIAAPWRHDPHCDHEAAARVAREAAAIAGVKQVAYPIWGWTLCMRSH